MRRDCGKPEVWGYRFRAVGCLATLALAGCGVAGGAGDEAAEERAAPAVEAVPARAGALPLEEELSGTVKARNQVAIRPEIEATVVEVVVRSGETVERGQVLVRLEDSAPREQLRQAAAALRLAEAAAAEAGARVAEIESQVTRTRALADEELVSALELETQEARLQVARAQAAQAAARVEQARATVEERRSAVSKTAVRAPVAGKVGQRNAEVGMLAGPATTLFLLGEFADLIVEVPLTEEMLRHVGEGTPVRIEAKALGSAPITASISRISPFLEEGSFSTTAEIDVDNRSGRLRPGMFVTVYALYGRSEQAVLVPASALWEDPRSGRVGLFVVRETGGLSEPAAAGYEVPAVARPVAFRPVEVLADGSGTVGVAGLEAGEWVVTVGQHLLHEGLALDGPPEGEDAAAARGPSRGEAMARVRPTTWDHVLELERLQREDLLEGFLAKQRRVARALGAEIPESEEVVDAALAGDAPPPPADETGEGGS